MKKMKSVNNKFVLTKEKLIKVSFGYGITVYNARWEDFGCDFTIEILDESIETKEVCILLGDKNSNNYYTNEIPMTKAIELINKMPKESCAKARKFLADKKLKVTKED